MTAAANLDDLIIVAGLQSRMVELLALDDVWTAALEQPYLKDAERASVARLGRLRPTGFPPPLPGFQKKGCGEP